MAFCYENKFILGVTGKFVNFGVDGFLGRCCCFQAVCDFERLMAGAQRAALQQAGHPVAE